MTVTGKANVSKCKEIISDALFTHDKKWIQKRTAKQLLKMFFLFNQGQLQLLVIVTKHGFTINMSRMLFRTIKK